MPTTTGAIEKNDMPRNADHGRENNPGKGKNLGQGLANIGDKDRRDLASGDDAPTGDQAKRPAPEKQGQGRNAGKNRRTH